MILAASQSPDTGDSWATLPSYVAEEIMALRHALRSSHDRLRQCALESTQRICSLTNELTRLEQLNASYVKKLEVFENENPLDGMTRCLESCRRENEQLREHNQRVRMLEKALADAQAECQRIAIERDNLASQLEHREEEATMSQDGKQDVFNR